MTSSSKKQGSMSGTTPKLTSTIAPYKYKPPQSSYPYPQASYSSRVSGRMVPSKTTNNTQRVSSAKRQVPESGQFPTKPPKTMTFINNKNATTMYSTRLK